MKSLLAAVIFSAWACPDLTGTYSCPDGEGGSDITTVTQAVNGLSTTYYVNDEVYEADGVTRDFIMQDDDGEFIVRGTRNVSCAGAMLRTHEIADTFFNNNKLGTHNVLIDVRKDSAANIIASFRGWAQFGDKKEAINETNVCTRL